MTVDSHILAYCAGVIDSDGTIGVRKSTYTQRRWGWGGLIYGIRVSVRQVTPEAIDLLHSTFGGCHCLCRPSAPNGRPLWNWSVTHRKAHAFLVFVLPYLRIKKAQAENAIALRTLIEESGKQRTAKNIPGRGGGVPRAPEISAAMELIYQRGKQLNVVGVRHDG